MSSINSILGPLFGPIFGPLYFSTVLSTGLYGVTCMQTFFYYVHYPDDPLRMKLFVTAVWAIDTIDTALTISGVYKYIIGTLMNPLSIADEIPELTLQILSGTMVAIPTQGFFIYRIYIFGGRNIMAPILWAIQAVGQLVAAVLYVAKSLYTSQGRIQSIPLEQLYGTFFKDITLICISVAAVVDVLIAIAMTYLLFRKRSLVGFEGSAHLLQRLTVFAVNTGIWTAIFAVLSVVLLRALPDTNLLYLVFAIPLASIYCNTLLANLNARAYIRGEAFTQNLVISGPTSNNGSTQRRNTDVFAATPVSIHKATEVVTFTDSDKYVGLGSGVSA